MGATYKEISRLDVMVPTPALARKDPTIKVNFEYEDGERTHFKLTAEQAHRLGSSLMKASADLDSRLRDRDRVPHVLVMEFYAEDRLVGPRPSFADKHRARLILGVGNGRTSVIKAMPDLAHDVEPGDEW